MSSPSTPLLLPEQASSYAASVDNVYLFLLTVTFLISTGIAVAIVAFAVKYRRRSADQIGAQHPGSHWPELACIVILTIIALGMFLWGARVYYTIYSPPTDALEIYVVGRRWMWTFRHPEGQAEINELHVPVGRDVRLVLATEDVVHSLYVPAFRLKMDVVPGRYRAAWFRATRPGRYHLFCAEYCGTNHSRMGGWIEVMAPTAYQAWLEGGAAAGSLASSGERLFQELACHACHRQDTQGQGPVLVGVFGKPVQLQDGRTVVADEAYIRESILDPAAKVVAGFQPIMPPFRGLVSEEQLLQLVAYLRSLGTPAPAPSQRPPSTGAAQPSVRP